MGAGNGKQHQAKVKSITATLQSDLGAAARGACPIAARQCELGWDCGGVESLGGNDLLMTSGHSAESFLCPGVKGQTAHSLTL